MAHPWQKRYSHTVTIRTREHCDKGCMAVCYRHDLAWTSDRPACGKSRACPIAVHHPLVRAHAELGTHALCQACARGRAGPRLARRPGVPSSGQPSRCCGSLCCSHASGDRLQTPAGQAQACTRPKLHAASRACAHLLSAAVSRPPCPQLLACGSPPDRHAQPAGPLAG